MNHSQEEIEYAFETFANGVQEMLDAYREKHLPSLDRTLIKVRPGSKYWKLIRAGGNQESVFGFVRKSDGAIFKPANWRTPFVKGPSAIRGHVTDPNNGMSSVTPYGVVYAR